MYEAVYWCDACQAVFKATTDRQVKSSSCRNCGCVAKYLSTDVRPVFARERRILQFYGYGPLLTERVWRSSRATSYFIDGELVRLPSSVQLKSDLSGIGDYIADSDHYDAVDVGLLKDYKASLAINRAYMNALEDEAFQFVNNTVKRFPRRMLMISFSGGKDSTVVSDLVRRGLGSSDILHIFGDTTLEDENTYRYVKEFREQNPLVPFFEARAEHDFHDLVDEIGPPSRVMRWCCTIFKAGPINNLLQTLGNQKVLTFYGIRRDESTQRSKYHRVRGDDGERIKEVVQVSSDDELNGVTVGAKIGQQITASPIIDGQSLMCGCTCY
ncbi:MAG: phosphoadenosine phosphosulfate reductase family protein [Chloroflexi bacterium]|nr:phosphoadenosine phosphosulfate reductase family protein [Chloroflexota bacterium]